MQRERKSTWLALALALVSVPSVVAAQTPQPQPAQPQQQPTQQQACTAQLQPAAVATGNRAVPITVTVAEQFGEVTAVNAPAASGIALTAAADLPREPLAAGQPAPSRPIAMGDAANKWIVYLNLAEAEAGNHQLSFRSSRGQCTGQLTVR